MKYFNKKLTFKHGDLVVDIPNGNLGWSRDILTAGVHQLDAMLSRTSGVFAIRFDCHAAGYSEDNNVITTFRRRFFKRLRKQYPDLLIGYIWVREQEKSKQQHYHFMFMVDIERISAANIVLCAAGKTWEGLTGIHPHNPKKPYYIIKRGAKGQYVEAIERMSYLSKFRGKGYRPSQAKDYGTSRIKLVAANDPKF